MSITFKCRHCGTSITVPANFAGKKGKCPRCMQTVNVPVPKGQGAPVQRAPSGRGPAPAGKRVVRQSAPVRKVARRRSRMGPPFTPQEEAVPTRGEVKVSYYEEFEYVPEERLPNPMQPRDTGGGPLTLKEELYRPCPHCGHRNPDGQVYCSHCAQMVSGAAQ